MTLNPLEPCVKIRLPSCSSDIVNPSDLNLASLFIGEPKFRVISFCSFLANLRLHDNPI